MPPVDLPSDAFGLDDVIGGKYRVERVLGSGGMGMVLAAVDINLERPVAIKVLLPGRTPDAQGIERFLREGRAAVKLTSEHVAQVIEVGVDRGSPFLVMEYLDGDDLGALLTKRGRLPVGEAVDYVLQACDAIAEAHAAGIVHRDLKPENLFLARRSKGRAVIKVLDFGISKVVRTEAHNLTHSGAVLGTPLYMAPEQMRSSRQADARTDVWALGVVLYELVTGTPPFVGESIQEVTLLIAGDEPAAPRTVCPDLPEAFEKVILRCLRKAPDERYPSVDALAAELQPFGTGKVLAFTAPPSAPSQSAPLLPRASASVPTLPGAPAPISERVERSERSDPRLGALARGMKTGVAWGTTGDGLSTRGRRRTLVAVLVAVGIVASLAAGYGLLRPKALDVATDPSASTAPSPAVSSLPTAPPPMPPPSTVAATPSASPPAASTSRSSGWTPATLPAPTQAGWTPAPKPRPIHPHAATASPAVDPGSVR